VTIENTYDYLANDRIPYGDPARIGNQARRFCSTFTPTGC
jgi:hypothetical protein